MNTEFHTPFEWFIQNYLDISTKHWRDLWHTLQNSLFLRDYLNESDKVRRVADK